MPFQAINLPLSTETVGKDGLFLEDDEFHLLSGKCTFVIYQKEDVFVGDIIVTKLQL